MQKSESPKYEAPRSEFHKRSDGGERKGVDKISARARRLASKASRLPLDLGHAVSRQRAPRSSVRGPSDRHASKRVLLALASPAQAILEVDDMSRSSREPRSRYLLRAARLPSLARAAACWASLCLSASSSVRTRDAMARSGGEGGLSGEGSAARAVGATVRIGVGVHLPRLSPRSGEAAQCGMRRPSKHQYAAQSSPGKAGWSGREAWSSKKVGSIF
ncbi:hypothetical protein BDK51DRAFT_26926 [Blyttiomyces helicus]|uniref:Uncharacterized protein n=1 Tax=Blyttiomyces helicus TaxID=388810 RepID=A0A4P9WGA8_9FUNG|nr:hypothetical protein BDK51DRAFT_26926 [Blyttiomyces helicus]|eukprot:RKO90060.1 hypothetical protein BDK51DRAFT_26926 [Blyttiomyces helicus]